MCSISQLHLALARHPRRLLELLVVEQVQRVDSAALDFAFHLPPPAQEAQPAQHCFLQTLFKAEGRNCREDSDLVGRQLAQAPRQQQQESARSATAPPTDSSTIVVVVSRLRMALPGCSGWKLEGRAVVAEVSETASTSRPCALSASCRQCDEMSLGVMPEQEWVFHDTVRICGSSVKHKET